MAVPADGITLEDKRQTTERLLRAGADIHALNTVRKHLSSIKGGWLAARAAGPCDAFAISDVVGDDPSFIASGPTVVDPAAFDDALDVLRRFGGEAAYPAAVVARLRRGVDGAVPETPKPGDAVCAERRRRSSDRGATRWPARSRRRYSRLPHAAARRSCCRRGPHDARSRIRAVLARARESAVRRASCRAAKRRFTSSAEAKGAAIRSSCSQRPACWPDRADAWSLASVGTDGIDGPTDAAGALADSTTLERAAAAGLAARALSRPTTTPTLFSKRWAISSTPVRPARTSATFK